MEAILKELFTVLISQGGLASALMVIVIIQYKQQRELKIEHKEQLEAARKRCEERFHNREDYYLAEIKRLDGDSKYYRAMLFDIYGNCLTTIQQIGEFLRADQRLKSGIVEALRKVLAQLEKR